MFIKISDIELEKISQLPFCGQVLYINIKKRANWQTGVYSCFSSELLDICTEKNFGNASKAQPTKVDKDRVFYLLKKMANLGLITRTGDRHIGMKINVLSITHEIHNKSNAIPHNQQVGLEKNQVKTITCEDVKNNQFHNKSNAIPHELPDLNIDNIDNINKINKGEGFSEFESPKEQEEVHTLIQKWGEVLGQDTKVSSLNLKHFIKAIRFYGLDKCISILELVDSNKEHKLVKWIFERDPSNPYLLFGLKPIGFNSKSPAEIILSLKEEKVLPAQKNAAAFDYEARTRKSSYRRGGELSHFMKEISVQLDRRDELIPQEKKDELYAHAFKISELADNLQF